MMTISTQTIQEIKGRVSPVQAIELYTMQQNRRGRILCPFHADSNPSVTVKGDRWTCWACGASGDVIDFTRKFYGIGFRDAVAKLGDDFGVPVEAKQCGVLFKQNSAEANTGKADPSALEERILSEIDRKNKREYRQYIDAEIEKLTICRQLLSQYGAPAWEIDEYDKELDYLISETVKMPYCVQMTHEEIMVLVDKRE